MAKTERLELRLTPEQKQQLQALAAAEGRSVSNYIEAIITAKIREKEIPTMTIENIWLKDTDNNLYIQKDGKIYTANSVPYRHIQEPELREVTTPLSPELYIRSNHLYRPSDSFLLHDLKAYGLELRSAE